MLSGYLIGRLLQALLTRIFVMYVLWHHLQIYSWQYWKLVEIMEVGSVLFFSFICKIWGFPCLVRLVMSYVYAIIWRNNEGQCEESAISIYSIFTILEALQVIYLLFIIINLSRG